MALTKLKLAAIRVDLQAALDSVAKKHGLARLVAGHCTFETTGAFTWKLEGIEQGGLAKEQRRYDENTWLGLPERGAEFTSRGKTHKTWGLNTTGSKVITECSDGARYNWPLEAIRKFFPKDPIASDLKKIVGACKDGGAP
jgi:hypothetical protein